MLATVLAGTVPAPGSSSAPGSNPAAGNAAMGNIIVTARSKAALHNPALPKPLKTLGSSRGAAWASWPADAAASAADLAVASPSADSGLFLAYLDESDFRRETEGLKGPQIAEVMRRRIAEPDQYLSDLAEGLAIETGRIGAWVGIQPALDIHREGYFTGHFLMGNAQDMEGMLRYEARIQGLELELLARADCPPAVAESLRKRDTAAIDTKLAQAAAALGMDDANRKRRDHSMRILFSREIFPWLVPLVESHDFVVEKTGRGFLIPQTPAEIAKLPPVVHPVIVFLDPAASGRAVRLLTPAQLDNRVAALALQGGLKAQDYLAELVDVRLNMLSILGKTLASIAPQSSQRARSAQPGMEGAYALIREEARQAAADLLGPADPIAGKNRLEALRTRIRILGNFAAARRNKDLAAWARNSADALEALP
jgi:hypothetical protein